MEWLRRGLLRLVWSSRRRKVRKLRQFARTEADGGLDIARVAERTRDPALRESLLSHARDEHLHASLFRNRAFELEGEDGGSPRARGKAPPRPLFVGDLEDVEYVAFLRVSEGKGAEHFRLLRDVLAEDPRTRGVFDRILADEDRHESYTEALLKRWRSEGREAEIRRAIRRMRRNRRWLGVLRVLRFVSSAMGRAILFLLYFTFLVPFAFLSRRALRRRPVVRPAVSADLAEARKEWA
jgi:hypothetical protein